jgi:hypothetical protein
MKTKICNKCYERKDISDFNKRTGVGDGYRKECKACKKSAHQKYMKTEKGKESHRKASQKYSNNAPEKRYLSNKEWRERNPNKYKAHGIVAYAIKKGELIREKCACGCGENVHAHHDDYAKPLDVRWLCNACHNEWHAKHGEALNP